MLRDPARRKIIELLGGQGKTGFKELRSNLGLGVGTVYYHLDMLSDFVSQDKSRKYSLSDRGQQLYRSLKDGSVSPTLRPMGEALSHRLGRWLFLSPVFAKTVHLGVFLPVACLVLALGAFGSASAKLELVFFFYFQSSRSFESLIIMFIFYWFSLFLIAEAVVYVLFRHSGGDLQLFACLGVSAMPLALFPYIYMGVPVEFSWVSRYAQLVLQVWTLLLVSSALSYSKGLRLDRSIIVSLVILYFNISLLLLQGRLA